MLEIEAYINRTAEVRRKEISSDRKQPGKVKRPMNSFMLYRKAFQNHTKAYCEHNNHQVVSKVCGASWDQEPEHIRKQFADWAKMERANHQLAHPGYKFTPAKPKNQKRRH
ncbi:high mobility group box domain-containing protein, partial [Coniella lustricola]